MKVEKILWSGKISLRPHDDPKFRREFWQLNSPIRYQIYTDKGMCEGWLSADWTTDLRSGSRPADYVIPKDGNDLFRLGIFNHDASYSGWLDRALSDELLRAVWVFCKMKISGPFARLGWLAVRLLGWTGYYKKTEPMPAPYTRNRSLERIVWHEGVRYTEIPDKEMLA